MAEETYNSEKKGTKVGIRELRRQEKAMKEKIAAAEGKPEKKERKKKEPVQDDDDSLSAKNMLADMREAYKSAGGRAKLKKLIKQDDKLLMSMVTQLVKLETQLMEAEIKGKNNGLMGSVTFVVIKGLHDVVETKEVKDKTVDIAQIQDAFNPTTEPKQEAPEEKLEVTL